MNSLCVKRLFVAALCLCCFMPLFSQSNAVYLKDGDMITGFILDMDSLGQVRIQTTDGRMLSIPMNDVENINWSYVNKVKHGPIYRYGDMFRWERNNLELSDKDYDRFFDDELYHNYVVGRNQFNIGGACWVAGLTCTLLAALTLDPFTLCQDDAFYAYLGGAGIFICLGHIYTQKGKSRLDLVGRAFNEKTFGATLSLTF